MFSSIKSYPKLTIFTWEPISVFLITIFPAILLIVYFPFISSVFFHDILPSTDDHLQTILTSLPTMLLGHYWSCMFFVLSSQLHVLSSMKSYTKPTTTSKTVSVSLAILFPAALLTMYFSLSYSSCSTSMKSYPKLTPTFEAIPSASPVSDYSIDYVFFLEVSWQAAHTFTHEITPLSAHQIQPCHW